MALKSYLYYYLPFENTSTLTTDLCGNSWTKIGSPTVVTGTYPGKTLCRLTKGTGLTLNTGKNLWSIAGNTNVVYYYIIHFWISYFDTNYGSTDLPCIEVNFNNKASGYTSIYDFEINAAFNQYKYKIPYRYRKTSNTSTYYKGEEVDSQVVYIEYNKYKSNLNLFGFKDPDNRPLVHVCFVYSHIITSGTSNGAAIIYNNTISSNYKSLFGTPSLSIDNQYCFNPALVSEYDTTIYNGFATNNNKNSYNTTSIPTISIKNNRTDSINIYVGQFMILSGTSSLITEMLNAGYGEDNTVNTFSTNYVYFDNMVVME